MKKTYIISEIGINHNGSLDIAKEMIAQSKKCRCSDSKKQISCAYRAIWIREIEFGI